MRKILLWLMFTGCVLTVCPIYASPVPIPNGDISKHDMSKLDWTEKFEFGMSEWTDASGKVDTTVGHEKPGSLHITSEGPSSGYWIKIFPGIPGFTYRISTWIKSEDAEEVSVGVRCKNKEGNFLNESTDSDTITGTNDWTLISVDFQVPQNASYIAIFLKARGKCKNVWFDDIVAVDYTKEGSEPFRDYVSPPVAGGKIDDPVPFIDVKDILDITLLPLPSKGTCKVGVKIIDEDLARKSTGIRLKVLQEGSEEPIKTYGIEKGKYGEVDIASLPPGNFVFQAELMADDEVVARKYQKFNKPDEPWRGTKVGVTDKVLPPWTPVQVTRTKDGLEVSVWGRKYLFQSSPFPISIITRGEEILAKPIQWQMTVEGKSVEWNLEKIELERQTPSVVTFRTYHNSGIFRLETLVQIEYDGMVWCESDFIPEETRKVGSLELVIPLKVEHFRYRQFPQDFMATGVNDVNDGGEYIHELPRGYCWIGDEERGLSWFFVNPGQFKYVDTKKAMSIVRSGKTMALRIRFIDQPVEVKKPVKYTFGFHATPTRPLPKGWRMRGTQRGLGEDWQILWTDEAHTKYGGGYPEANNPTYYRAVIDSIHRKGEKAVQYLLLRWRDRNSPEWHYNRYDWELPGAISDYSEELIFWHGNEVCAESESYRDWLSYKVKKFVEDYGLDGLYHDLQWPYICSNLYHGCGTSRYSILGARELNRRVYAILQGCDRPMMKIDHYSNTLCDPIASFSDAVVSGEEMAAGGMDPNAMEPWRVTDDYFKIPGIRGHLIASGMIAGQRGQIPWFIPENQGGNPEATRGLLALLLPMDSAWTIWNGVNDFREMHQIWRTAESFGLGQDDVVFTGYWSRGLPVSSRFITKDSSVTPSEKPIVSVWSRGKNGALLVIANQSTTDDGLAEVNLDLDRLGLVPPVEISNAEAPIKWYSSAVKFKVLVRKKNFRFVWVRPASHESADIPLIEETAENHLAGYLPESIGKSKGDIEVGKVTAGDSLTKFGQVITLEKPIKITFLKAHVSFGGKIFNYHNPVVKEGEFCHETGREPQVNIVEVGEDGLPMEEKVVVANERVTYSQFRPGEDLQAMTLFFDRIIGLPAGKYAVIFSKEPENPGESLTYSLAGYPQNSLPGGYGLLYNGEKWTKLEKIAACGLFGPVIKTVGE